jgi:DNA-binding transcriptional MerR regulator
VVIQTLSRLGASYGDTTIGSNDFFFIGELTKITGLEPKTIRFYEKAGLMNPQRHGRFRTYKSTDVDRLSAIRNLRKFGVSLSKIKEIISLEDAAATKSPNDAAIWKILKNHLTIMICKQQEMAKHIEYLGGLIKTASDANSALGPTSEQV